MYEQEIHIGGMIRDYLEEHGIKHVWLAQRINTVPSNIAKILAKENMDVFLLMRISRALGHDFLKDISQRSK